MADIYTADTADFSFSEDFVQKERLMTVLGYFFLFLHTNICFGYWVESPWQDASN